MWIDQFILLCMRGDIGTLQCCTSFQFEGAAIPPPKRNSGAFPANAAHSKLGAHYAEAARKVSCQRQDDEAAVEQNTQALTRKSEDACCGGVLMWPAMQDRPWPDVQEITSSHSLMQVLESDMRGDP